MTRPTVLRTHCAHGHEFTPENTYTVQNGSLTRRKCRQCRREREARGNGKAPPLICSSCKKPFRSAKPRAQCQPCSYQQSARMACEGRNGDKRPGETLAEYLERRDRESLNMRPLGE